MSLIPPILFGFLILYAGLLGWFCMGYLKTSFFNVSEKTVDVPVTIIICARNEERYLEHCLNTLIWQNYHHEAIEIIFVNDASNDKTLLIAERILGGSRLNHRIISNSSRLGKKKSLSRAIELASHDLIITRDADSFCLSKLWLKSISEFYTLHPSDMIIAPIAMANNNGLLWALQAIENNVLAMVACGSAGFKKPFLCSGANLAFTKAAYIKAGGYQNHHNIESGDDVLFLHDLKKTPDNVIRYLKCRDAIVHTFPMPSLISLLHQKIRWASKFKNGSSILNFLMAVTSFAANAGWLFCLIFGFVRPQNNSLTLLFVVGKLVVDFLLLLVVSGFIKNRNLVWYSLPVGFIYPVYACLVGLGSLFFKPEWKR